MTTEDCKMFVLGDDELKSIFFLLSGKDILNTMNLSKTIYEKFQRGSIYIIIDYAKEERNFKFRIKKAKYVKSPESKYWTNKDYWMYLVLRNNFALYHAPDSFKSDREIVLSAIKEYGYALRYVANELKSDFEIVLKAVKNAGFALEYAADEMKSNRQVVMAAVKNAGFALEYAADELKSDREVVLAAVQEYGLALEYAADELKSDREIVLTAVERDTRALQFCTTQQLG